MPEAGGVATPTVKRRTRAAQALVPRDRVLHAAARLFRKNGFKGTTVRDIGCEVGILSGSLFHHFPSKEAMLVEIMREAFVSLTATFDEMAGRETDPVAQLHELIRLEFDAILGDRRDYHAVLYFDWRDAPAIALPELMKLRKRYRGAWTRTLEACHAQGRLRCEPDIAAHVIFGAMRDAMTWFRKGGRHTPEYFGGQLAHLFIETPTDTPPRRRHA